MKIVLVCTDSKFGIVLVYGIENNESIYSIWDFCELKQSQRIHERKKIRYRSKKDKNFKHRERRFTKFTKSEI